MNSRRPEHERLLDARRPGGADDKEPPFAEALRAADGEPEWKQQLEAQREFDGDIARRLQAVPVPSGLKEAILARKDASLAQLPKATLIFSRRLRGSALVWAAAAALVLGAGVRWLITQQQDATFSKFRRVLIAEAWGGPQHLEFQSTDLGQVLGWLAARGAVTNLALPEGLRGMRVHGCEVMEAKGHRVAMLCLGDGPKHLHLLMAQGLDMKGLPGPMSPDFERLGGVNTVAWRRGDQTFVLAGLKPQAFVTKFRRAGRWVLSG
jgi:hypothetical protein